MRFIFFFFFQAEDGIRDLYVTGVQTCALPISRGTGRGSPHRHARALGSEGRSPGGGRGSPERARGDAGSLGQCLELGPLDLGMHAAYEGPRSEAPRVGYGVAGGWTTDVECKAL